MSRLKDKVALVTGASSGIGEACAIAFAREGASVVIGARRFEKLKTLAETISQTYGVAALPIALDVRDERSCENFIAQSLERFGQIDVLVNNAGLARGRDFVAHLQEADMREMFETNVFAVLRLTRLALDSMLKANSGHIINIGSVAGYATYEGGASYCATKFGVRAISEALRFELLGKNIRVSSVSPGLVRTEFSLTRFRGDAEKARRVYEGYQPLSSDDVAECVIFAATRPPHVDIEDIIVRPTHQAGFKVHRANSL
ncbi:MAG: SDR family NAD(P)-dependent oxidoreductase [Chloroherpetonaceae bacterium]|nr:SDR family NAD(P)-dependent oxidoreductase [Chloroherpetonaceae bacterium]